MNAMEIILSNNSEQITKNRILICGGAGYLGCRIVPELISRGHAVTVLDTFWFGDHLPYCQKLKMDAADLVESDLMNYDCVIWLAGLSNDPMANFSPQENYTGNAATPALICYLAKQAGVKRFIHGGSCSVYGNASDYDHDETSKPTATYPYGVAKLMAETGCQQQVSDDFSVIMLRKGTVSGWSPRQRFDLIINTMFKDAMTSRIIKVNNPDIWRPILAIEDAVEAYVKSVEAPLSLSGIFNVVSENVTVGEVAERVANMFALFNIAVEIQVAHKSDPRNYRVNGFRAKRSLLTNPRGDVETIVGELWEHRAEFGDFKNPEFYNIEIFKELFQKLPADSYTAA